MGGPRRSPGGGGGGADRGLRPGRGLAPASPTSRQRRVEGASNPVPAVDRCLASDKIAATGHFGRPGGLVVAPESTRHARRRLLVSIPVAVNANHAAATDSETGSRQIRAWRGIDGHPRPKTRPRVSTSTAPAGTQRRTRGAAGGGAVGSPRRSPVGGGGGTDRGLTGVACAKRGDSQARFRSP